MVENDHHYHVKKSQDDQTSVVYHSLISRERTQKLELLIHLLANSSKSLVVYGPVGIGKTTLLKALQEHNNESWLYCPIQANVELTFEKIWEAIDQAMKQDRPDKQSATPAKTWGQRSAPPRNLALMIDDAGLLAPGLISTLLHYALTHPVVRLILVLTNDDLYIKNRTDADIEDCHFIDIPPLSEKQCGDFLQYLSTKHRAVSLNSITDDRVETLYRETHGIPGKIIAEVPSLGGFKKTENSLAILVVAVAGLVAVALGLQWFSASDINLKKTLMPALEEQKTVTAVAVSPLPEIKQPASPAPVQETAPAPEAPAAGNTINYPGQPETTATVSNEPATVNPQISADKAAADATVQGNTAEPQAIIDTANTPAPSQDIPTSQEILKSEEIITPQQPAETAPVPEEQATDAPVTQSPDEAWFTTQPADNYTLQVMALSKEQSILNVLNKYPSLNRNLKYLKSVSHGKERFILYYGSFKSADLAKKTMQTLPPEFSHALIKKISAVKK